MNRIQYKCVKCSWSASVPEAWGDLRPQFCGNKKCQHSFRKNPSDLLVVTPVVEVIKPVQEHKTKQDWKKSSKKEETQEQDSKGTV